jgi:uncharacterized protein (DUF1697 family)
MIDPKFTTYVTLLRGINVGGKNKVPMQQLKNSFERLGLENVKTYINSGNILFTDKKHSQSELVTSLEKAILKDFGFGVKVLLRTAKEIDAINAALPKKWINDDTMKCDVMFLWKEVDSPKIVDELKIVSEIDIVKYIPGTIMWSADRKYLTRSGMMRLAGTKLYKSMTIRNCNTVRKLAALLNDYPPKA